MLQRVSLPLGRLVEDSHIETGIRQIAALFSNESGFYAGYYGRQVESLDILELFMFWESFSSYSAFSTSPTSAQVIAVLSSFSSSPTTYLANINPTLPKAVLTAPVVEVLTFSNLTSDRHLDPVRLPNFRRLLGECDGWTGDAVGPGLNVLTGKEAVNEEENGTNQAGEKKNERTWLILGGWQSVEVHKGFQASESFKERPGVDGKVEACHVVFREIVAES